MRLAALPLVLVLTATPAAAQIVINGSHQASASQRDRAGTRLQGDGWDSELRQTARDARRARERGEITRQEARNIRRQVAAVQFLGSAYAADGLSEAELDWLESQALAVRELAQAPNRPAPRRGR